MPSEKIHSGFLNRYMKEEFFESEEVAFDKAEPVYTILHKAFELRQEINECYISLTSSKKDNQEGRLSDCLKYWRYSVSKPPRKMKKIFAILDIDVAKILYDLNYEGEVIFFKEETGNSDLPEIKHVGLYYTEQNEWNEDRIVASLIESLTAITSGSGKLFKGEVEQTSIGFNQVKIAQ